MQFVPKKGGGTVTLPKAMTPIVQGKRQALEHPAMISAAEAHMLKLMTDGKSNKTQFGKVPSFTDPSQAYGGDLSGTQTSNNWNGSGSQPSSSGYDHGGGTNPVSYNNGATSGYSGVSSSNDHGNSYDHGGGTNPDSYNNGATSGYSRSNSNPLSSVAMGSSNSVLKAFASLLGSGALLGTQDPSTTASKTGLLGNSYQAASQKAKAQAQPAGYTFPTGLMGDRVSVDQVGQIPTPLGSASTINQALLNAGLMGRGLPNPGMTSPMTNARSLNAVNDPSGYSDTSWGQTPKVAQAAADDSLAGIMNPNVRFQDPRAGYYDQNGVTPQTQFADRLREETQLYGMKPNDTAIAAQMGNLMNEKLPAYLGQGSNMWDIGSPAAKGDFAQVGTNPDGQYTAWGAPQWNSGRLTQAKDFFSQNGLNPNDPNSQAAAIAAETAGQFPGQAGNFKDTYASLAGMSTPQATQTWMRNYENPSFNDSKNHIADRQASAQQFAGNNPDSNYQTAMAQSPMAPPQAQVAGASPFYGAGTIPKPNQQMAASPSYYGDLGGPATLQQAAASAPIQQVPTNVEAAAQSGGAGFNANGTPNLINANWPVANNYPKTVGFLNNIANRPYDPRTAGTMDSMIQQASAPGRGNPAAENPKKSVGQDAAGHDLFMDKRKNQKYYIDAKTGKRVYVTDPATTTGGGTTGKTPWYYPQYSSGAANLPKGLGGYI